MTHRKQATGRTIYILCSNHFDPIWRRGFRKPFTYKGEKYVSSMAIQDACISDWLEICRDPDVKFEVECSLVLRTYLDNQPEKLEIIRRLAQEGRLELRASGEVIADTNLPSGETLARNLLYGLLWGEQVLGVPITTGCLNDAFGSSAQIPQLLRGCGVDFVAGISYKKQSGRYWKGLDGTVIRFMNNPGEGFQKEMGAGTYYTPCPACGGEGCETCLGRGFDQSFRMDGFLNAVGLDLDANPFGLIHVGGEETMAPMDLAHRVRDAQNDGSGIQYKFGLYKDIIAEHFWDDLICRDDCPSGDISPDAEANPVQTGCYVSRIKVKQNVRRLEYAAMGAEKLAALASLNGREYPYGQLTEIWRNLALASFHDCITGTHIDAGYEELMELFAGCDKSLDTVLESLPGKLTDGDSATITVFNPHAFELTDYVPVGGFNDSGTYLKVEKLPPFGLRSYPIAIALGQDAVHAMPDANFIENEYYRITVDRHGITGIFDKKQGLELIAGHVGYANELLLEHDVGDPWCTREAFKPRTRLGRMAKVDGVTRYQDRSEICLSGEFKGNDVFLNTDDYRVLALDWKQTIILWDSIQRVDFRTEVYWSCFDRRIRISFPTMACEDDGYYAVPYGTLKRKRYNQMNWPGNMTNPDGDWPAVEWFSTAGNGVNVAIMNRGTPSSRIEKGEMLMSVLRSPTFPGCGLLWPKIYDAPVYDGMRDAGSHVFEYSLTSFSGCWNESDAMRMAYQYNGGLVSIAGKIKPGTAGPGIQANGTEISAFKKAEDGNGYILRLNEYRGMTETVELTLPFAAKACEVNLLEKNGLELPVVQGRLSVEMKPFQIRTLRVVATISE